MTTNQLKRRQVLFFRRAAPLIDSAGLIIISFFLLQFLPREVLNARPASGGDMGSHYWPLDVFVNYGASHWSLRTWNPGNLAGEPHLLNYFPTPFLIMAALSTVMPAGTAFNIGTLLPLLLLPIFCYVMGREMRLRFPVPLLLAASTLPFLYNEGNSMWGGNTLSVLAGQFAHEYALCFLLLAIGAMFSEMRRSRPPLCSALFAALASTCHGYVLYGLPLMGISFILFVRHGSIRTRVVFLFKMAVLTLCLSLWHLGPLLTNISWTTPYSLTWTSAEILKEIIPPSLYPSLCLLFISLAALFALPRRRCDSLLLHSQFWLLPTIGYVGLYFVFPKIGLVDVRTIPQIQLFCCICGALLAGELLRSRGRLISFASVLPIVVLTVWWSDAHVKKFPFWLTWNYSGWETKKLYPEVSRLSESVKGTFTDPRIIYEHNKVNEAAGSLRVFEMLPYFANRATLESVYLQASVVSPEIFYLQALVSETPSCPFSGFQCAGANVSGAEDKLRLFGVGEIIVATDKVRAQADDATYLEHQNDFSPWHLYKMKEQPELVGLFNGPPKLLPAGTDFKREFYDWFSKYHLGNQFLVMPSAKYSQLSTQIQDEHIWSPDPTCRAKLDVDFNSVVLHTTCPGKAHFLKFGFHPTWSTDTGDELFLTSPGFIGLVPSSRTVTLRFGVSRLWQVCTLVSLVTSLILLRNFVRDLFKR